MSVSLRSDKSTFQPARDAPSFQSQHFIKVDHVKLRIDLGRFRSEWRAGEKAGGYSSATGPSASRAKSFLSPQTATSSRMTRREKSKTSFGATVRSDQIRSDTLSSHLTLRRPHAFHHHCHPTPSIRSRDNCLAPALSQLAHLET